MRYRLAEVPYNRKAAVAYADYWAYRRNPKYYAFDEIGGDCTNFVSQCVFAGCGVMNDTPDYGWYYYNVNDRAPAWTGVGYFYRFLTENRGAGPFGREASVETLLPGDVIHLVLGGKEDFSHTVLVMESGNTPETIRIASHDNNANCRPLATYAYSRVRGIRIEGARHLLAEEIR